MLHLQAVCQTPVAKPYADLATGARLLQAEVLLALQRGVGCAQRVPLGGRRLCLAVRLPVRLLQRRRLRAGVCRHLDPPS